MCTFARHHAFTSAWLLQNAAHHDATRHLKATDLNSIFIFFGIESWKPVITALILPPVPFLLLMLIGARLILPRRGLGWLVILSSVALLWLSTCTGMAQVLSQFALRPPAALTPDRIKELKAQAKSPTTAILVLGGGLEPFAPEYGVSNLRYPSLERLRYGLWLSRETGLPVGFSGGIGLGGQPGPTEAEIAARIAEREFGRPLRWTETESRDTRENAFKSVALLQGMGIEQIVLVTHDYHMRRSLRNFERAAEGKKMQIVPAPMGLPTGGAPRIYDWLPSRRGFEMNWLALHEWLGLVAGA